MFAPVLHPLADELDYGQFDPDAGRVLVRFPAVRWSIPVARIPAPFDALRLLAKFQEPVFGGLFVGRIKDRLGDLEGVGRGQF